jgi:hypothetical protein
MTDQTKALNVIDRQIRELDTIYKQASQDLNTVRGKERVTRWKKETVALLTQHVGQPEAQRLAALASGPSFTNDLLEELSDEVEEYRVFLVGLLDQAKKQ